MKTEIILKPLKGQTQYAPLCVLGYCLTRTGFLKPVWDPVNCSMKVVDHKLVEKLQDMLVSILAGNTSVSKINTRIRPDLSLAVAWDRSQFAEQSTISRTLDALKKEHITQLHQGSQALFRQNSRTMRHDYEKDWLLLDIDPTHLPASRHAQDSCQGYVSGRRNQYGRQWCRIGVVSYHETLCSILYPGNQQGCTMLIPSISMVQKFLGLTEKQRQRTILRSDASIGTDANINWLLWANYQVLMKGFSGNRAVRLVNKIAEQDWLADAARKRWISWAPDPPRFARRINMFSLRWQNKSKLRYGTLLSTLFELDPLSTLRLHDGRGAIEVEIKADKQGLKASTRRKKSFAAQEGLILLTDLAHNILSWTHHWVLENGPFDNFGTKRMVEELMCIPGQITIKGNQLHKVALLDQHPFAENMRFALLKLLDFFGNP